MPSTEPESLDSHKKYRNLKRKLKALIYENECFQEELKKAQRKLLKVSRDKSFLLDRLLKYEIVESSSSDSEATASSDSDSEIKGEPFTVKKKKTAAPVENQETNSACSVNVNPTAEAKKKKNRKACPIKTGQLSVTNMVMEPLVVSHGDGHMTSEEIERHLEAKQTLHDLMPEKAPLTVPVEMFSNEPSGSEKCHVMRKPEVCKPGLAESTRLGGEERVGPTLQVQCVTKSDHVTCDGKLPKTEESTGKMVQISIQETGRILKINGPNYSNDFFLSPFSQLSFTDAKSGKECKFVQK